MRSESKTNIPLNNWVHKNKLHRSLFGTYSFLNEKIIKKYFKNCDKNINRDLAQFTLIFPKKYPILRILIDEIAKKIYNLKIILY